MRRHIQLANLSKTGSPLLSLAIQSPGKQHQMQLSYEDPTIKFSKNIFGATKFCDCFLNCTFGATNRIGPESHMFHAVSGVSGIQKSPAVKVFSHRFWQVTRSGQKHQEQTLPSPGFSDTEDSFEKNCIFRWAAGKIFKSTNRTKKSPKNVSTWSHGRTPHFGPLKNLFKWINQNMKISSFHWFFDTKIYPPTH